MLATFLVDFYRFWHGKLHLRGAGFLMRLFQPLCASFKTFPLAVPGLGRIWIDLTDVSGGAWLNFSLGEVIQEHGLIQAMKALVQKNNCVIWDVGANAGYFAASIIRELPNLQELHLFEPNPAQLAVLNQLALLDSRVRVHPVALSDKAGELPFYVPSGNSTLASLEPIENALRIDVACVQGDVFSRDANLLDPDIVVIDTEGNEPEVLRGMAELINRQRPIIFFEHIFLKEEVISGMIPAGYKRFIVDNESGVLGDPSASMSGHNSALIP